MTNGPRYTSEELDTIREMFSRGLTIVEIAHRINRPPVSLSKKMRSLGLRRKPVPGVRSVKPEALCTRTPRFIRERPAPPDFLRKEFTKPELREMLAEAVRNTR
jgi:hypothetical protein